MTDYETRWYVLNYRINVVKMAPVQLIDCNYHNSEIQIEYVLEK